MAVVDLGGISGGITVRYAGGDEPFLDLGSSETAHPERGEVVFVDDAGQVHARRWCWRQSGRSATGPHTGEALFVTEGLHDGAMTTVQAAVADLSGLLAAYQPDAGVESWLLSST